LLNGLYLKYKALTKTQNAALLSELFDYSHKYVLCTCFAELNALCTVQYVKNKKQKIKNNIKELYKPCRHIYYYNAGG
jgi:hypothetical protein